MNNYKEIIKKYKKRYIFENLLKSFLISALVGFLILLFLSLIFYFVNYKNKIIIYLSFFIFTALLTAFIYFFKYRQNEKEIIKKIDQKGLENSLITMYENIDNNSSFIIKMQREDAISRLNKLGYKKEKLKINKIFLISFFTIFFISISFFIFYSISIKNKDISFLEIKKNNEIKIFELIYLFEEGGQIEGEIYQQVKEGSASQEVLAVPDYGYIFDKWSDGNLNPLRVDLDVKDNKIIKAHFIKIDDIQLENEIVDLREEEDFIEPKFKHNGFTNGGAGGKYEEKNQVIDGKIYYKDILNEYIEKAKKILKENNSFNDDQKDLIENYFETIK